MVDAVKVLFCDNDSCKIALEICIRDATNLVFRLIFGQVLQIPSMDQPIVIYLKLSFQTAWERLEEIFNGKKV